MKGVRCSWVDMLKIRQSLKAVEGDLARLAESRCVDLRTVQQWRRVCDVIDALETTGGPETKISSFKKCQPSHLYEIGAHFLRREKVWSDDTRQEIAEWVDRVEREELTSPALRAALRVNPQTTVALTETCTVDDLRRAVREDRRFATVYADPPWPYANQATRAATDNHYPTMSLADITEAFPPALAPDRAHLFLWTTNGFLREAFEVLGAWGFEYRSLFVWCKPQLGIGNYWRVSHELLLLGVRGGLTFRDHSFRSWQEMERQGHSAKPEKVRRMIEQVGYGPRLELFARHEAEGWTVWGNQIERTMFDRVTEFQPEDDGAVALPLFPEGEAS